MIKWAVLSLTIVFWGLAFTAIKYAVYFISPVDVAVLRFAIADVLFAISILNGRRIELKDVPLVFVLGLFGVTIYHVCLNVGEVYISSGVASLIIALAPIFVLFLSWKFLNERINLWKIGGTVLAFSGVALISEPSYANIIGILLVLISAVAASIYTTLGKKLMEKYDAITLTSNAMVLGSIPLLLFVPSSIFEIANSFKSELILSIIFLGLFPTYFGYLGWYYFLSKEEASKASIFLLAIPLVSLIAGYILLGEVLTLRTLAGSFAVIAGIYLVLRG
ncbi:DMT family transporter [Archaeoglobus neptunius]|uniref:DMT family transporter n=1 Tax=Archaeoglobus neptunius TaxID=2798580 RepID=UPI0019262A0D|nr:DMT family transporter [Archaeoglobus neptunius]